MTGRRRSTTLGEAIFSGIEKNEYLNELYDAILYNYGIKLFGLKNKTPKDLDIDAALRFADLLSKSTDSKHGEEHRGIAQEMVSLLRYLYPSDERVEYFLGSVLSNTGNFYGMEMSTPNYSSRSMFDRMFIEYNKKKLTVPAAPEKQFMRSQKEVYDHFFDPYFSYSAPTSMGKSFVMQMFIKQQIQEGKEYNFVILVPTKALISEVKSDITKELDKLLIEKKYRVITSAGSLALQEEQGQHYVFVLTPERLLYLLMGYPNIDIDFLFTDEAQKISSLDGRSTFYFQVIRLLTQRINRPHFIFASPNIPNPEVYLELVPNKQGDAMGHLRTQYSPVSQEKFLIDIAGKKVSYYNNLTQQVSDFAVIKREATIDEFINLLNRQMGKQKDGKAVKSIVYCNSKDSCVQLARAYAEAQHRIRGTDVDDDDLKKLSKEIRELIHTDYYLADTIANGVAYHMGYLPTTIRGKIEAMFRDGAINTLFCTSTLLEGVNLPADNLFVTHYNKGRGGMSAVDFKNLIGRVGRLQYNLYGNVFFVSMDKDVQIQRFVDLLHKPVEPQKLSVVKLKKKYKECIIESLTKGDGKIEHIEGQSYEEYSVMRKFQRILLQDIVNDKNSRVRQEFSEFLRPEDIQNIKEKFEPRKEHLDEDINISSDQTETVTAAIAAKTIFYPKISQYNGYTKFSDVVDFLEHLCELFNWEMYEKKMIGNTDSTGKHAKLKYYAVLLQQWIKGDSLRQIMDDAIAYKVNSGGNIIVHGKMVQYDNSLEHRNAVIGDTLDSLNGTVLFRLANYFMRFSNEYKKVTGEEHFKNDWYEFIEYGAYNPVAIYLQKMGFTRESAAFVASHEDSYIIRTEQGVRIKSVLFTCGKENVIAEANEISINVPELFQYSDYN